MTERLPGASASIALHFRNCGSCDEATLAIDKGRLNIKYGANGVGKSTMARAVQLRIAGNDLHDLLPFKERRKSPADQAQPSVEGWEPFKLAMTFNEDYINQFVFTPDELLKDSFDIFVRTSDYETRLAGIEERLRKVKKTFENNAVLDQVLADLDLLSGSFGRSTSIAKNSKLHKAIGSGNKIEHVPERLQPYRQYIQSSDNVDWIGWQIKGTQFSKIDPNACPYCVSSIAEKREMIGAVALEYDAKSIEHLVGLRALVVGLEKYFSIDARAKLAGIFDSKTALRAEEVSYLTGLRSQIDTLRTRLSGLRNLSFFTLRGVEDVVPVVQSLKINLELLPELASEATRGIVDDLNAKTDLLVAEAGHLKGDVAKHQAGIQKTIQLHSTEINAFLEKAGYRYTIDVVLTDESYKLRLRHIECEDYIEGGRNHLSFGEKNALSLVLFMYECRRNKPDLVILDDPISSFDKNKKYAVMDMLFRGSNSLQGMTTLMFTHDIEPVIDACKTLRHTFNPVPKAFFLELRAGRVNEKVIAPTSLQTFGQICKAILGAEANTVLKVIYLRRHYEILDEKGLAYNLLASLLHGRERPTIGSTTEMKAEEVHEAEEFIRKALPDFNYAKMLEHVRDIAGLKAAYVSSAIGYDKLQLFRMLMKDATDDNVLGKFVNEAYHIENEHIVQLSPREFEAVPEHIISACDARIAAMPNP